MIHCVLCLALVSQINKTHTTPRHELSSSGAAGAAGAAGAVAAATTITTTMTTNLKQLEQAMEHGRRSISRHPMLRHSVRCGQASFVVLLDPDGVHGLRRGATVSRQGCPPDHDLSTQLLHHVSGKDPVLP